MAGFLTELSMPLFRGITGKSITLSFPENFSLIGYLLLIALGIGLLAGSYPAFFVASFSSIDVMKSSTHPASGIPLLRRGLVTFQFLASILLLVGTLVIFKQLHFPSSIKSWVLRPIKSYWSRYRLNPSGSSTKH